MEYAGYIRAEFSPQAPCGECGGNLTTDTWTFVDSQNREFCSYRCMMSKNQEIAVETKCAKCLDHEAEIKGLVECLSDLLLALQGPLALIHPKIVASQQLLKRLGVRPWA